MFDKLVKKYSFDIVYFFVAISVFLVVIEKWEIIDIGYLCILTYYYIRIKIHRRHTKYLI